MNNQTKEQLRRIAAKQTLGLPLTTHESAMLTLYGNTDAAKQDDSKQRAEFVRKHVAPLLKAAFVSVDEVFYRKEPQTLDEFITTRYFDGRVVTFIVTRDPLPIIAYKALCNVMQATDGGAK